ncbi:uncharacterized protein LOC117106571, partial [Anneissia japonica]|uniref:uncharacterized protein LOC117106571 n=1 Tax=Anneissia japonica TaxID=1529436 RepID=UPI001425823A
MLITVAMMLDEEDKDIGDEKDKDDNNEEVKEDNEFVLEQLQGLNIEYEDVCDEKDEDDKDEEVTKDNEADYNEDDEEGDHDTIPDITAFSTSFIVKSNSHTNLHAYTGVHDNVANENVMFGVGLWVDDNRTHYGENELKYPDPEATSIFPSDLSYPNGFSKNPKSEKPTTSYKCMLTSYSKTSVRRVGVKYMWTEINGYKAAASMVFLKHNECPRGKWLPPDCENDCPVCYNGGVCSVPYGLCICPPGFKGDNCEQSCGWNSWGRYCTIICSSSGDKNCKKNLFCPPDPVGCSCMSGFKGLSCNTECDTTTTGKYGPGCLLDCHCDATECQLSKGCNEDATCHSGYNGTRCLERDPNVECPEGFYGPQCTKLCHCENSSTCDRNNGSCPDGDLCEDGWGGVGCQQALPGLYDAPSVEYSASSIRVIWTAWDRNQDFGNRNASSYALKYWKTLSTDEAATIDNITDTRIDISISLIDYNQSYSVTVSVNADIDGVSTQGIASPVTAFSPIEPPSFSSNPCKFTRLGNFSTVVTCDIWSFDAHSGMGIVQGYTLEYWNVNTPSIVYSVSVDEPVQSRSYTVLLPEVYVYYSFKLSVMVIFEHKGVYMNGTRSSLLSISKAMLPDLTAFSAVYIVDKDTATDLRAYTGWEDKCNNENVMFGIGLWVDDNGTRYGENELINSDPHINKSIFTPGTIYEECKKIKSACRCWLTFPPSDVPAVRRVGVKYSRTEFNGYKASASMVFLANGGTIVPEQRTITTSIGETVKLVMMIRDSVNVSSLRWKKDGRSDIIEWEGLSNATIENVRQKDAGIYECYPEGRRHEGQHAIVRVIVR